MLKALKAFSGKSKVTINISVKNGVPSASGKSISIDVPPGHAIIEGSVSLTVETKQAVSVSALKVSFSSGRGRLAECKVATADPDAYSLRVSQQEVPIWHESRTMEPGTHCFPFAIPFHADLPNTTRAHRDKALDITHNIRASLIYRSATGSQTACEVAKELCIFRWQEEDETGISRSKLIYKESIKLGEPLNISKWKCETIFPTHVPLGKDLELFVRAEKVEGSSKFPVELRVINCRLIEKMVFYDGAKIARVIGRPVVMDHKHQSQLISVNTATKEVLNLNPAPNDTQSTSYFVCKLPTSRAQPRVTHSLVSITHEVEITIESDCAGIMPDQVRIMASVRVVHVNKDQVRDLGAVSGDWSVPLRERSFSMAARLETGSSGNSGQLSLSRPRAESMTMPPVGGVAQVWQVTLEYSPKFEDEIALAVGDGILIRQDDHFSDGWARGVNLRTMQTGIVPIALLAQPTSEPIPAPLTPPITPPISPALPTLPVLRHNPSVPPRYSTILDSPIPVPPVRTVSREPTTAPALPSPPPYEMLSYYYEPELPTPSPTTPTSLMIPPRSDSKNPPMPMFQVVIPFVTSNKGEIGLDVGHRVTIRESTAGQWAVGTNMDTNVSGRFPIRCVVAVNDGETGSSSSS